MGDGALWDHPGRSLEGERYRGLDHQGSGGRCNTNDLLYFAVRYFLGCPLFQLHRERNFVGSQYALEEEKKC